MALGFVLAPVANADLDSVSFVQAMGAHDARLSQERTSSCDSNYSGACVPIDSDADCAGGSGNGPSYVSGPVTVIGDDVYGLD